MKCERVLTSLATGGAVARWRARRHIRHCLQCAEARVQLREITRELANVPPLTAAQRALWTAAGVEPNAARPWHVWVYLPALAATAAIVLAIGLTLWALRPGPGAPGPSVVTVPPPPAPAPTHVQPSELGNLATEMLARVDRLDHELAELRRVGDLLDVRRDADALWDRYGPRKTSAL